MLPDYIVFAEKILPLRCVDCISLDLSVNAILCEYHVNQDYRECCEDFAGKVSSERRFEELQKILGIEVGIENEK